MEVMNSPAMEELRSKFLAGEKPVECKWICDCKESEKSTDKQLIAIQNKYYDFYIPTLHLLVEVDGEYWHRMVPAIKNDLEKHVLAKELKYNLLRITNLHWFPELIFESNYSKIISHNYAILNKRTIECQNYELAISIV